MTIVILCMILCLIMWSVVSLARKLGFFGTLGLLVIVLAIVSQGKP